MILPPNLVLMSIEVIGSKIKKESANSLPEDWRCSPSPLSLKAIGSEFLKSDFPIMELPSVAMPFDSNFLINPNHEGVQTLKFLELKEFLVEGRLLGVYK